MDVSAVDLDLAYQLKGVKITRAERDRQRAILIGAQYHRTIEIEYFSDFFNLAVPPPWHDADLAGLDHAEPDAARGLAERFDRRQGPKPFELFRPEFAQHPVKIREFSLEN